VEERKPKQLSLPFQDLDEWIPHKDPIRREIYRLKLEGKLATYLEAPVNLAITDNVHTMVSTRPMPDGGFKVRAHHMFLTADRRTIKAMAHYVARPNNRSSRVLGGYIRDNRNLIRERDRQKTRRVILRQSGKYFDLQELLDDLNKRYFNDEVEVKITWGKEPPQRRRHSMRMGAYIYEDRLIRINPGLDREFVPRYFIEWIVFHEMLHDLHSFKMVGGRRMSHTNEFHEHETRFEHYEAARQWEIENLHRLLS